MLSAQRGNAGLGIVHFQEVVKALAQRKGAQHVPRDGSKLAKLLGELLGKLTVPRPNAFCPCYGALRLRCERCEAAGWDGV